MNYVLLLGTAVAAIGALVLYELHKPMAFAAAGDTGDGSDSGAAAGDQLETSGATAAPGPAPSGVATQWNSAIASAAKKAGIDPVLLKAIVATETGFNPDAINPEKSFVLEGVSYAQYDRAGQRALVAWIKDGNDPATIGLNPSLGIAQVRVSNGKKFIQGLDAWDLFDPAIDLEAAAYLIADDGTSYDTIDMYNVGNGSLWARGVRNASYRTKAQGFYGVFKGDF